MGCSDSSVLSKITLAVLLLALILHVVGLATPRWSALSNIRKGQTTAVLTFGIWEECNTKPDIRKCITFPNNTLFEWLKVCRVFAIAGGVAVLAANIMGVLCAIALSKTSQKVAYILATITAFVGAASIITCAIVWVVNMNALTDKIDFYHQLSWSFALSISAGVLSGIGGVLLAIDLSRNRNVTN